MHSQNSWPCNDEGLITLGCDRHTHTPQKMCVVVWTVEQSSIKMHPEHTQDSELFPGRKGRQRPLGALVLCNKCRSQQRNRLPRNKLLFEIFCLGCTSTGNQSGGGEKFRGVGYIHFAISIPIGGQRSAAWLLSLPFVSCLNDRSWGGGEYRWKYLCGLRSVVLQSWNKLHSDAQGGTRSRYK